MKKSLISIAFLWLTALAYGQGQQNVWTFGDKAGLDFNTGSPMTTSNNLFPGEEGCSSICDASGQLLFYSDGFWVWDRLHHLMPALTAGIPGYSAPVAISVGYPPLMPYTGGFATQGTVIAGAPSRPGMYYLFSLSTIGQLYYSMIDMSLNGGNGDIVISRMRVPLGGGFTEKLTVVNGCNSLWLMTRARTANQYLAYEINDTGIVTVPVISNCGQLPLSWYTCGTIKFSPDGTKMAAACNNASTNVGGLELYDFDAVSGKLTNAAVLDSSSTLGYYYGACFSPDNSKLYATISSFSYGGTFYAGKVRQFNVGLSTTVAIIASNTLIFTDPVLLPDNMGDLKRGNDGKVYLGNGRPAWPFIPYMHRISLPNVAGTACTFVPNALALPTGIWTYRGLPNDVAIPIAPDTVRSARYISACFTDSITLTADTGKHYTWNDGSHNRRFTAHASGIYIAAFTNANCKYAIDTYKVNFVQLPIISPATYSCAGQRHGSAWVKPVPGDTTTFTFTWQDAGGNVLQQHIRHGADTIKILDTGSYTIRIHTPGGCDTTLPIRVIPIPLPQLTATADTVLCRGVPGTFSATTNGYLWSWNFGDGTLSGDINVQHTYSDTGTFTSFFAAKNIEGCSDTAYIPIHVMDFRVNVSADRQLVNRGELVTLQTSATRPYAVTAWEPSSICIEQTLYSQTITMDTTRLFIVTGKSVDGCIDTASIEIAVNPTVFLPTAFTPNGDGNNDRFRPLGYGYIFVRNFTIYNRWGEMVYCGYGKAATEGWDGSFHGVPAEMGAYFYTVDIETESGGTIALKGDVTLVR